jgi:hypothetical protein
MMTWLRCSLFSRLFFDGRRIPCSGSGWLDRGVVFSSSTGCDAEKARRLGFAQVCRERECARWSVFLCRSGQVNASRERETF